jgi:UDP-N-acetylmuramoylalanine--D-glutamate ligase
MINADAFADTLDGKPVALFGLGRSGMATIEWLTKTGIKVTVWDDRVRSHHDAKAFGADVRPLTEEVLAQCAYLILAPGVPLTHPEPHNVVKLANKVGIEIIGDIEILHRCKNGHQTIGITGTNGKSTTTALLTHVLNTCGKDAVMGGNIGVPALAMEPKTDDTILVLEVSSYQIDLCSTFHPDIGVLLNVTPDHIDRHGSFENYFAIKNRMMEGAKHRVYGAEANAEFKTFDEHEFPRLPGVHNQQNIKAVLDVCEILGVDQDKAIEAVKTFPGLAHRQFLVRTIDQVDYINDSKATNAEAASKALSCHKRMYWIVGGQAKDGGLSGLEEYRRFIKHAYLIGQAAPEFEKWMIENRVDYTMAETLGEAVPMAHKAAQADGEKAVVLLSPACASWDQFRSFEARGDRFIELVEGLEE